MPVHHFARAFAKLEGRHEVDYFECAEDPSFAPASPSEQRLSEFLGSPAQLVERMASVEVLAVQGAPVTDRVLDASDALRLVCCARGGPLNIDVEAVTTRGLPLVNTPGKNAEAVADMTLAFLVMLARGFPKAQSFLQNGGRLSSNWDGAQFFGHDLRCHTLGLVGYGMVGRQVASRAHAFGLEVLVYDPYASSDDAAIEQLATLEELLSRADFVSLHARATDENAKMIDATALATMRPGTFLINTAREGLVDEQALDDALASGHLAGAALDVAEPEGSADGVRLLRHENVVMTPHIGGATHETLLRGAEMISAEISRFAAGEPLVNVLNPTAAR
jgi:D-3-phosphoglycerate dehydrogenase